MSTELAQFEHPPHETIVFRRSADVSPIETATVSDAPRGTVIGGPRESLTESARVSTDEPRHIIAGLRDLPNDEVAKQVVLLNRRQQLIDAELLLYLGELDARRLYRDHACSSMFVFLTTRLGKSEDVAYRWMWGARLLRKFPLAYELLADGGLHLSALMLLKPHLNDENHRDWLTAAVGKSKREVEKLVAARCPMADVPTRVRKLPDATLGQVGPCLEHPFMKGTRSPGLAPPCIGSSLPATGNPLLGRSSGKLSVGEVANGEVANGEVANGEVANGEVANGEVADGEVADGEVANGEVANGELSVGEVADGKSTVAIDEDGTNGESPIGQFAVGTRQHARVAPHSQPLSRPTKIQPLSEHSYRVVFTASQRLKEKFERAAEVTSHSIPHADLPALIERALDLLIEREEGRRYGVRRGRTSEQCARSNVPTRADKEKDGCYCGIGLSVANASSSQDDAIRLAKTAAYGVATNTMPIGTSAHRDFEHDQVGVLNTTSTVPIGVSAAAIPADNGGHAKRTRRPRAQVRREVWERDGGQCTYVDAEGRRCQSRNRLEFDHCIAHALGGDGTVENIRLRCKAHNMLAAEQVFGVERIAAGINQRRRTPGNGG